MGGEKSEFPVICTLNFFLVKPIKEAVLQQSHLRKELLLDILTATTLIF